MRMMNESFRVPKFSLGKLGLLAVCLGTMAALPLSHAVAGTDMKEITPPACDKCSTDSKDWELELGAGVSWSNVRSGQPNQAYTIVPISLRAAYAVDDVSLDHFLGGIFRGYTEFFFEGDYGQIVHGPEPHYEGIMVGPRYNFVQPGWVIIPYVEGGVGIDFADSNPQLGGLGQDFNFTFEAGAGAKYNITDDVFVRLGVEYQHLSNAGLSEPTNPNHPIDELGPRLSVGYSF